MKNPTPDRIAPGAVRVALAGFVVTSLGLLVLVPTWLTRLFEGDFWHVDCRLFELNPPGSTGWDARCRCSDVDQMWEEQGIKTSFTGSDLCWDGTPLTPEQIEARMPKWDYRRSFSGET